MPKCSHWDCGGNLCVQIQQPSQKALPYHYQNFPAGWMEPQVLFALLCALVHSQSSTVQEFSIFPKPISDHTLGPSCCHCYFSLNPGRQSCNWKVTDVQLLQACQSLKLRQVLPQLPNTTFKIGTAFNVDVKTGKHPAWSKARESLEKAP